MDDIVLAIREYTRFLAAAKLLEYSQKGYPILTSNAISILQELTQKEQT